MPAAPRSAGGREGLREIDQGRRNAIRRLVLLTDGQPENETIGCARPMMPAGRGVPITALGVGKDWKGSADRHSQPLKRQRRLFDQPRRSWPISQNTVQRAQATAIHNAVLTLRLVQGITRALSGRLSADQQLGYRPVSDRDVSVPLGELETGSVEPC